MVFDYRGGRSGEYARQFLGDWEGHLLVDDFSGYKALFSSERQEANACIELGLLGAFTAGSFLICIMPTAVSSAGSFEVYRQVVRN